LEEFVKYFLEKNGGILIMNKEKALKNQGLEFREDIIRCWGAKAPNNEDFKFFHFFNFGC